MSGTGASRFAGRAGIVTGAASGIGRAVAQRLAAEGGAVVLIDRDAAGLSACAAQIESAGGRALPLAGSVCDASFAGRATAEAQVAFGRIDWLVTAAAVSFGGTATETSPERWDEVIAVNLTGTFLWCRAVLPAMVAQGSGSIVTVASQLALAGGRNNAAYVASKGAVLSFTRAVALDYAAAGVRANALVPAAVETPMLARAFARAEDAGQARARSRDRHPVGRFARPEEVAAAAAFLVSEEASFTTGSMLPVDGGWLAA